MKSRMVSLSAAVAVALSGTAYANSVTFDPTSLGVGASVVSNVSTFDWSPSNVLAKNGNQAFANFVNSNGACPAASCAFDVFVQGKMTGFLNPSNNTIPNLDVGSKYEITFELGFQEQVTGAAVFGSTNIANFGFVPSVLTTGAPNFFRAFIDPTLNANDLTGLGFGNGTLLLSGGVAPVGAFTSSFTANTAAPVAIGGQSSTTPAAWTGVNTVQGTGSTSTLDLLVAPMFVNNAFFGNTLQSLSFTLTNASQAVPFTTVDPSLSFPLAGVGSTLAEVGAVNGGTSGSPLTVSGPSIIFQSDANSPLNGVYLPEPASLALLGIGLAGVAVINRRKRNPAA